MVPPRMFRQTQFSHAHVLGAGRRRPNVDGGSEFMGECEVACKELDILLKALPGCLNCYNNERSHCA